MESWKLRCRGIGRAAVPPVLVKKRQTRLEGFLRENPGALCAWHDDQGHPGSAPGIVERRGLADVHLKCDHRGNGRGARVRRIGPWSHSILFSMWIGCRVKVRENRAS